MYPVSGRRRLLFWFAILVVVLLVGPAAAQAEENASGPNNQCLQCHGQPGLATQVDGKEISLYVDSQALERSKHAALNCTSCHQDKAQVPHEKVAYGLEQARQVQESCATCHAGVAEEFQQSIHGQTGAVTCSSCHGNHEILPATDPASPVHSQNLIETCGQCHEGPVTESYAESFHGKAVSLGSTEAATCVSCHGSHDILLQSDPASPVHKSNIPGTCAQCHTGPEQVNFTAGIEHFTLEPEGPGMPMYYTFKFFTWLTILTMSLLIIHIELELFRRLRTIGERR